MTQHSLPFTLSHIQVNAVSSEIADAGNLQLDNFDDRTDFLMGPTQSSLAVLMAFTNERRIFSRDCPGIRRKVQVVLIDVTDNLAMASTVITIGMRRELLIGLSRVDLPFYYRDITPDHTYKIMVRDHGTKTILGEKIFRMFDECSCGNSPEQWYTAEKGALIDLETMETYKSAETHDFMYRSVKYWISAKFKELPLILPELEMRIYFPDDTLEVKFCTPVCDDYATNEYHVEMPFMSHLHNKGACYTEILCFDYVIAGFVFTTKGITVPGIWSGKGLDCLDEYTMEAVAQRLHDELDSVTSESDDMAEPDEFEKALRNFISSETDNEISDEIEYEDESEADDEVDTSSELTEESVAQYDKAECETPQKTMTAYLESLIGLTSVKEKLNVYEKLVKFNRMRLDNGFPVSSLPLHAMFLGSPGTGKTTVAKMMGRMLAEAGVLSRGHVVVKERSTLIGPNYSTEETNTLKAIEEAQGGILLIDEAYQLYQPNDPRDPGKFVIETLLSALADESKRDWMLILAGYPKEMKRMFDMNPGFKSRIPESNIYIFNDFNELELMSIAERYLERYRFTLSDEARSALAARLQADYAMRDRTFGNARHVVNLIQTDVLPAMAVRVMKEDRIEPGFLSQIQACDIPAPSVEIAGSSHRIGYRA